MKKSASVGAVIGGVVVVLVIVFFLYQHFMSGPKAIVTAPPGFIDPATNRPRVAAGGKSAASGSSPAGMGGPVQGLRP